MGPAAPSPIRRKPPINGSFPLDHGGACQDLVKGYLRCLATNGNAQEPCKHLIKAYLECRAKKGLLKENDEAVLGLGKWLNE